ncbi:MAG TPA: helix-turn-helix domain-containing protein [Cytophagaceae bacterium]|jgi:DNA-binding HxlR family transcriptional regulator|nr:helix-turn-helix domain-containing protein [Cytophagaceae bacterium]
MENKRKNKDYNPFNCGVTHFLNLVGGKWKVLVIFGISKKCNRFSLLKKAIPQISKQMLINQLRELEEDKLIEREIFPEVPPRVEYRLTSYGNSLLSVILQIQKWGANDLKEKNLE